MTPDRIPAFELSISDDFVQAVAERVAVLMDAAREQQLQRPDVWLTTAQAARYLNVPVSRIYRAVSMRASAERPIPLHKDGARNFFMAGELDEWRRQGGAG
jgi:excisionase family DNA binding protein